MSSIPPPPPPGGDPSSSGPGGDTPAPGGTTPPPPGGSSSLPSGGYSPPPSGGYTPPPAFSPSGYGPPPAGSGGNNGLAIAALVCGILTFVCLGPLAGIAAVVLGFLGLSKAKEIGTGRGMSIAGIVLGAVGTVIFIIAMVAIVLAADDDDGFEGINTDPSNGVCNEDRFLQDPDC